MSQFTSEKKDIDNVKAGMTEGNKATWDLKTQTYHGGQDWRALNHFVEDFSVTTNGLGTPKPAMQAAKDAINHIHHYPAADFEPALTELAEFLWPDAPQHKDKLLLGNGASELIDLVIRGAKPGTWCPGPTVTQYKEYSRSAQAAGFTTVKAGDPNATLTCMVNPTNPTGDYMDVETMKKYIEDSCCNGCTIIVDESMQPWLGSHWREDSLIHQREWCKELVESRNIHVWVMTSWTKIWSCTGIRLGSVVAPTEQCYLKVKAKQVPWSVNCCALDFLSAVVKDTDYMNKTWEVTPKWNANARNLLRERFPEWKIHGEPFLSWLWVDVHSKEVADEMVKLAKEVGCPLRSGGPGYNLPTFIRIAVRDEKVTKILIDAWEPLRNTTPGAK